MLCVGKPCQVLLMPISIILILILVLIFLNNPKLQSPSSSPHYQNHHHHHLIIKIIIIIISSSKSPSSSLLPSPCGANPASISPQGHYIHQTDILSQVSKQQKHILAHNWMMQVSDGQGSLFLDQAGAGVVFGTIQRSNMWGGAGRKNTFEIFDRQKINKIKNNKIFHILNWKAWAV